MQTNRCCTVGRLCEKRGRQMKYPHKKEKAALTVPFPPCFDAFLSRFYSVYIWNLMQAGETLVAELGMRAGYNTTKISDMQLFPNIFIVLPFFL